MLRKGWIARIRKLAHGFKCKRDYTYDGDKFIEYDEAQKARIRRRLVRMGGSR